MQNMFIIVLYLVIHISIAIEEERITIPCHANTEQGVQYRKITWYKVEEGSDVLTGLVLKDLHKNITVLFKFANHSYVVGEDNSLQFLSAAGESCGIYRCTLWPPLGHYIQEKDYEYYSADCIEPQLQPVLSSSRNNDVPVMNHLKFLIIPCVLLACSVLIFLVNLKMMNRAKNRSNIKEKLVVTEETFVQNCANI